MLKKVLFTFLIISLFGGWFIWGPFCPFCIDTDAGEGSCEESRETCGLHEDSESDHQCGFHNQDECRNCSGEFAKLHIHEKFVFTLSGKFRAGENPLAAAALTGKTAAVFQFRETEPVVVSADAIYLSLESLFSVVMLV